MRGRSAGDRGVLPRALIAIAGALGCAIACAPAATVRADVVWTERCPWGARERTSHAGPRCAPWPCASDAECEGGLVCRPWRVCTQTFSVPPAGLGAFRQPPPPPTREEQVVGSCDPAQRCSGDEEPRPPTSGEAQGAVECREATYCVRPTLPALPSDVPAAHDTAAGGGSATTTDPQTGAAATPADAPATSRGCACRAGARGRAATSIAIAALIASIAAAIARRRRRAR